MTRFTRLLRRSWSGGGGGGGVRAAPPGAARVSAAAAAWTRSSLAPPTRSPGPPVGTLPRDQKNPQHDHQGLPALNK